VTSRVTISVCGAVGLVVLARAAAYYARVDALALGLVAAMAVALVGSIAELLARVSRAERMTREVAALPRPATTAAVEGASEGLRPLLLARIAATPGGGTGAAPLAGYVVGLLVMLGLLGTFLGLFETLRGAREALGSSGDVESLRASLAAPMQGLTRSFGTSAAGVSASAMLGLAVAIARGVEGRFGQVLSVYSSVALAPLTVQGRQLDALERLAKQGDAWPKAVIALDEAAGKIGALQAAVGDAHARVAEQAATALRGAVEGIRVELERAVVQSASAAEKALAPLVRGAVEGSVEAVRGHVADVGARMAADLEARREADERSARVRDEAAQRLAASEDARTQALAARWEQTTRALESTIEAVERRGETRDAAFAKASADLAEGARGAVEAATARLDASGERSVEQGRRIEALAAALESRAEGAASIAEQQRDAVSTLVSTVATRIEALDAQARAAHEEQRKAVDALVGAVTKRIEALDGQTKTGHEEQRKAVESLFAALARRAEALDAQMRSGHELLIGEIQRGASEHTARAGALEREVGAALSLQAERVVQVLETNTRGLGALFEPMAAAVRDAAAGVSAGGAELSAVAEMFAAAVDRHREGANEWLTGLGTIEGAIARVADEGAGSALDEQLDRARELYDAQLQFHRELLMQLRGVHVAMDRDGSVRDLKGEDAPA
jgi:hypothetical protein